VLARLLPLPAEASTKQDEPKANRIDIQAKLKEKLGVEFPKYLILGVCPG
jgi:hypothetical protein